MRRINPARKSAKKSGGSKIKIREKSVLPKAGPKRFRILGISFFVAGRVFGLWVGGGPYNRGFRKEVALRSFRFGLVFRS